MTCETVADRYFAGELAGVERDRFVVHLIGCRACQKRLRFLGRLEAGMEPEDVVELVHTAERIKEP